jgi:uncharacterized protein (TIGR00251 family)
MRSKPKYSSAIFLLAMAASLGPIRLIKNGAAKSSSILIELHLRVKPGASKMRQGISTVRYDAVELCVAAPPRDGEANKAVVQVLSAALGVPKSTLQVVRGSRSRDKVVLLQRASLPSGSAEDAVQKVAELLKKAGEAT